MKKQLFQLDLVNLYKGGKRVLAKIADTELDCFIFFYKRKNDWINGLKKGSEFNCRVEVLQFDKLYDRIVLGGDTCK